MYRATKVRIYPDERQQAILRRHIGHSRAVYNFGLRWAIWQYWEAVVNGDKPKSPSHFTLTAWLTEFKKNDEVAWLNEVPVNVLSLSLERLARAYSNFFKRRSQGVGFPRLKGRHSPKTARYSRTVKISDDGRSVSLPPREVGWIPMKGWRPEVVGTVKTCTLELAPSNRWYLSIMIDDGVSEAEIVLPSNLRIVAVHCGLKDHVTVYDGSAVRQIENPKILESAESNLTRKARKLSRKAEAAKKAGAIRDENGRVVYSKRREKARILLARVHARTAFARQDHLNKLAREIAKSGDVVILETWQTKKMLETKECSKDISDAGWSMLFAKVEMKVREFGGRVVKLDKFYPSSQICANCEVRSEKPVPPCKEWTCAHCGTRLNRNVNAARNVYRAGLAELSK